MGEETSGEELATHVLVRVWLPDRPGALGLVAARIGSVGGDIVGVDVLERSEGIAVDEFAVVLPNLDVLELLAREIEQVDGTSVEQFRVVGAFPDAAPRRARVGRDALRGELHRGARGHARRPPPPGVPRRLVRPPRRREGGGAVRRPPRRPSSS